MKILRIRSLRKALPASLLLLAMLLGISAMPMAVSACSGATPNSSQDQALQGVGETGGDCTDSGVTNTANTAVSILSTVVGIAAVIMILVSAFKYITSNGDSAKIGTAKTTLIYALIGLAIVALTQILIHFVLSTATSAATPCPHAVTGHPNISINDPLCR